MRIVVLLFRDFDDRRWGGHVNLFMAILDRGMSILDPAWLEIVNRLMLCPAQGREDKSQNKVLMACQDADRWQGQGGAG
jgi:hypothetical protein